MPAAPVMRRSMAVGRKAENGKLKAEMGDQRG
jgi:hypothetical protein